MYYLEAGHKKHTRMRSALVAALVAHLLLVAVISFDLASQPSYNPQIEVTLASRPSTTAPDDARHIAQSNQQGSGQEDAVEAVTSSNNALPTNSPTAELAAPRQIQNDEHSSGDLVSTSAAAQTIVAKQKAKEDEQLLKHMQGISPEVDRLNQELASLQAELDEQTRSYSDRPRVRRLTAVSAKQAADAAYLLDWRRRLEAVGNKYYPEASARYGLFGELRLLVIVRKDGSLEGIRVLSSSGYAVLDEAAIKIVRLAAPFAPFPAELRATTDKLEIIRTWQFQDNKLSSK